jgi:hypothetical protein
MSKPDRIWALDVDLEDIHEIRIEDVFCTTKKGKKGYTEYIRADLLTDPEWLRSKGLVRVEEEKEEPPLTDIQKEAMKNICGECSFWKPIVNDPSSGYYGNCKHETGNNTSKMYGDKACYFYKYEL